MALLHVVNKHILQFLRALFLLDTLTLDNVVSGTQRGSRQDVT